jgi:hypothetical protein
MFVPRFWNFPGLFAEHRLFDTVPDGYCFYEAALRGLGVDWDRSSPPAPDKLSDHARVTTLFREGLLQYLLTDPDRLLPSTIEELDHTHGQLPHIHAICNIFNVMVFVSAIDNEKEFTHFGRPMNKRKPFPDPTRFNYYYPHMTNSNQHVLVEAVNSLGYLGFALTCDWKNKIGHHYAYVDQGKRLFLQAETIDSFENDPERFLRYLLGWHQWRTHSPEPTLYS